jgi:menaquinone-dependent protoporphyrinogen oxidase
MSTIDHGVRHGRALVAYATKHGSTEGIAAVIGETLRGRDYVTDVRPAREVRSIDEYDLVIVGSALYMFRWMGDAVDFLKRFEHQLSIGPTWLFSSGPTGGSADADAKLAEVIAAQPAPPKNVAQLAERIGIRGHRTFGGRATEDMGGLFERWLPKGDWRDLASVRAWADEIADTMPSPTPVVAG